MRAVIVYGTDLVSVFYLYGAFFDTKIAVNQFKEKPK